MSAVRRHRDRQAGLTLVEVIVALAVLSLIVLALGASLRGLSQSAERVDQRVDAVDEMRVSIAFLRDVLERTSMVRASGPERRLLFDAGEAALAWVGVMPARFGAAGRFAFRLAAEPLDDGSQGLVLRYAPWTAEAAAFPDWAQAEHRVLVHRVERLALAYGGQGLAEGWQPGWTDKDKLPPRLRLDLATTGGAWPPVVLPVRTPPGAAGGFVIGGSAR
jgi:general secretion pathway protein J